MAWIESHQGLRDHPKTSRLARSLGIHRMQAIGHLHALWWWCISYADDGDMAEFSYGELADAAGWEGDADDFYFALRGAGWLDEDGKVHDWYDYAGRLVDARRHEAGQKRKHRELYNDKALTTAVQHRDGAFCRYCGDAVDWKDRKGPKGATYDYVDPWGTTTTDNVVVACRACNAGKGQRTPEQAGYRLISIDDPPTIKPRSNTRTVPNRTVPKEEPNGSSRKTPRTPQNVSDGLWTALEELFGPVTESHRSRRGKIVKGLRALKAAPEDVSRRAAVWPDLFPGSKLTLTDTALEKFWGNLGLLVEAEKTPLPDCDVCWNRRQVGITAEGFTVEWDDEDAVTWKPCRCVNGAK